MAGPLSWQSRSRNYWSFQKHIIQWRPPVVYVVSISIEMSEIELGRRFLAANSSGRDKFVPDYRRCARWADPSYVGSLASVR
jgi:hypothetical protein